ncbi:hypothetical protein C8Q79DRAFT_1120660 [Trametes meyenii]|nr:hypothetical protein C8Q79DRAFT_1120660 [Trametes meyenii]
MADPSDFDPSGAMLTTYEAYWRELCAHLEASGYLLRPRYRPGWQPSWKTHNIPILRAEDFVGLPLHTARMIDATRISDGKLVYLKRVASTSPELSLCRYFSSQELRRDPRNHCVPLLDVILHPMDPAVSFMVMPFLRYVDRPPFETVEDVMDCGEQLLEGLLFMHEHGVAHRDCAYPNVMMDATALYPQGFHPVYQDFSPDINHYAPLAPRSSVQVTYFLVDFGISSQFSVHADESTRRVLGKDGIEDTVPELSDDVPYDPFKTDVYIIGCLMREIFLDVKPGVIDATRASDGKLVCLKKMKSSSTEFELLKLMSPHRSPGDPRNHCVPLLDAFELSEDAGTTIVVMPFLRYVDDPPFERMENLLDCGQQLLEGLLFLHEHNIAHRCIQLVSVHVSPRVLTFSASCSDCAFKNIMMDATQLYPQGFHPVQTENLPDISGPAPVLPRSSVSLRYFFLDFGISTRFPAGSEAAERRVLGRDGLERSVPELSDTVPYDPFQVDIYILGALFKQIMIDPFSNSDVLAPLVRKMMDRNPTLRPNAAAVLEEWESLRARLPKSLRSWRVKPRNESLLMGMVNDAWALLL